MANKSNHESPYAANGFTVKAPRKTPGAPQSTVHKGADLRQKNTAKKK